MSPGSPIRFSFLSNDLHRLGLSRGLVLQVRTCLKCEEVVNVTSALSKFLIAVSGLLTATPILAQHSFMAEFDQRNRSRSKES